MNTWEEIDQHFDVLISEINRIQTLVNQGKLKEIAPIDILHSTPRPDKDGTLLIGRKGAQALRDVSSLALTEFPHLQERVSIGTVKKEIQRHYFEQLWANGSVDLETQKSLITKALVLIEKTKLKTYTHIFPCVLSHDSDSVEFNIGPVRFLATKQFFEEYDEKLRARTVRTRRRNIRLEGQRIRAGQRHVFGKEPTWPRLSIEKSGAVLIRTPALSS